MAWSAAEESVGSTQRFIDEKALTTCLFAVSRGNPARAAEAISTLLQKDSNKVVKKTVSQTVFNPKGVREQTNLVIDGIRASILAHTKGSGSRTAVAETFVKNTMLSCVYAIVKKIRH